MKASKPFYRMVGAGYEFIFADPSGWNSGHYYYFSEDVPLLGHWETWSRPLLLAEAMRFAYI